MQRDSIPATTKKNPAVHDISVLLDQWLVFFAGIRSSISGGRERVADKASTPLLGTGSIAQQALHGPRCKFHLAGRKLLSAVAYTPARLSKNPYKTVAFSIWRNAAVCEPGEHGLGPAGQPLQRHEPGEPGFAGWRAGPAGRMPAPSRLRRQPDHVLDLAERGAGDSRLYHPGGSVRDHGPPGPPTWALPRPAISQPNEARQEGWAR